MSEPLGVETAPGLRRALTRSDGLAGLACMVVGLGLAIAPHLATLARSGTLDYLADHDDILYLTIARVPFSGEWTLRDPFARKSDAIPTIYPWAQFVPFTLPPRWFGLSLLKVALIWRVIGGLMLGGSLFVLFRRLLRETRHPTAWALGASLICLSDAGFVDGRSLVGNYGLFWHMVHGSTPMTKADALGQYRVVTPLLNLPFLLLLAASLVPGGPTLRGWTLLGIACLGACFHLYFFFWTAALPAILPLFRRAGFNLPSSSDHKEGRWKPALRGRQASMVLAGGLALGLPAVYSNARTFSNPEVRPILERMGRGRLLDRSDPVRTRYLGNAWAWGKIVLGGAAILAFRLRGLGFVWWLTLSGFALANSALVTGLEFENFHWIYVHAPMGEILILAIAAQLLDRGNRGRANCNQLFWFVPATLLTVAGFWRPFEATHAPDAVRLNRDLANIKASQPITSLGRLGPDDLASVPQGLDVASLISRCGFLWLEPHSYLSSVSDLESLHERHALNAWLQGESPESYRKLNREFPFLVVPSGDSARWSPEVAARRRLEIFGAIEADRGAKLLARYRPNFVLSGTDQPPRGGPWRRVDSDGVRSLWTLDRPVP